MRDHADDQGAHCSGAVGRGVAHLRALQFERADTMQVDVADLNRPAGFQQAGGHRPAHVADTDDPDRGLAHGDQLCTSRLALEIDIRMPSPMPSVTIAVPP